MNSSRPALIAALVAPIALSACAKALTANPFVLKTVVSTVEPYFHGPDIDGSKFEQLTDRVYTFRWNWYRNVIIDTADGLVVIDPMNAAMAAGLKSELDRRFPGKPVHTLIYSHYHLDHTRGGEAFRPLNVLAHEKAPEYWSAVKSEGVLPPTRLMSGDETLMIGGIEIHALYLGLSHSDTLYAFHLPSQRLVFAADLGLVKTVAPNGVPDRYAAGYDAALQRVAAIDFDIFVPSHFGYGAKDDLVEWREMMAYGRQLANEAVALYGGPGVRKGQWRLYFDHVYVPMKERYGEWHGFNDMFVLNLVRDIIGEALGD